MGRTSVIRLNEPNKLVIVHITRGLFKCVICRLFSMEQDIHKCDHMCVYRLLLFLQKRERIVELRCLVVKYPFIY